MKIRNDFVTNSSSSSFVMSFKDEEDYMEFEKQCEFFLYDELFKLIDNFRKEESHTKEELKEFIYRCYTFEIKEDLYKKYLEENPTDISFTEMLKQRDELEKTQTFIDELEEQLKKTDYYEKIEEIDKNEINVYGMIWDTSGGILEWSIRNGILSDYPLSQWCKICYNVG